LFRNSHFPSRGIEAAPYSVADDNENEMLRTVFGGLLRGFGHSVDVVANGLEAFEAAARHAHD
jgi:CheY-like chemotaxis protein